MKKVLSLLLVICMLITSMVAASPVAAEEEETPDKIYTIVVKDWDEVYNIYAGFYYKIDVSALVDSDNLYWDYFRTTKLEDGLLYYEEASQPSKIIYDSSSYHVGEVKLNVMKPETIPTGITLDKTSVTVTAGTTGESYTYAIVKPSFISDGVTLPYDDKNLKVYWTSDDPNIAIGENLSSWNSIIRAVGVGTTTVYAHSQFWEFSVACQVTVVPRKVSSITFYENTDIITELIIEEGKTYSRHIEAYCSPQDATNKTLTWSSDDESIARIEPVDNNCCRLHAVGVGTTYIRASATDGSGKVGTLKVTVMSDAVHSISFIESELNLTHHDKYYIRDNVEFFPTFADNLNLSYTSSDPDIAYIDYDGYLVANKPGTAQITAISQDGGHTATCTVNVAKIPVTDFYFTTDIIKVKLGETLNLKDYIRYEPANASTEDLFYIFLDYDKQLLHNNGNCQFTPLKEGSTILTTTIKGSNIQWKDITIEVSRVLPKKIAFEKDSVDLAVGSQSDLRVIFTPENTTNKNVTYVSSNPDVVDVTVGDNPTCATINAKREGTATITATSEDGGLVATCVVNVHYVPVDFLSASIPSGTIEVGQTAKIEYQIFPENASDKRVTFVSTDESVATVDQDGVITAVGTGYATVKIIPYGKEDGFWIDVRCVIPMDAGEKPYIEETAITLETSEMYSLNFSYNKDDAAMVNWHSSNWGVASVDNGFITANSPGNATITLYVITIDGREYTLTCEVSVCEEHPVPTPRICIEKQGTPFPFYVHLNDVDKGKTVIVAYYANNKLIYTESKTYSGNSLRFAKQSGVATPDSVKVFVWDSIGSASPICKAAKAK